MLGSGQSLSLSVSRNTAGYGGEICPAGLGRGNMPHRFKDSERCHAGLGRGNMPAGLGRGNMHRLG